MPGPVRKFYFIGLVLLILLATAATFFLLRGTLSPRTRDQALLSPPTATPTVSRRPVASDTQVTEMPSERPAALPQPPTPVQPTPSREPEPTPTAAASRGLEPTPGPTIAPDLALEFTTVRPNQVLSAIATRYGASVDEIVRFSGITNPDLLVVGQGLIIPHHTQRYTPAEKLLPDSELVYGPAYLDFDVDQFVASQGGLLASYSMPLSNGGRWSGAEVVERVAKRFSVGPRVLLALMEARSGWVTTPEPDKLARDYPLGHLMGSPGLLPQLEWAAEELNRGFYGWLQRGETAIRFQDGVVARGEPTLNPGTVAIQRVLAADSSWAEIDQEMARFAAAYRRLFGDPWTYDAGPVLPAGLTQPRLQLPWAASEWWYLTGGPHGGWGSGSGWAALDFVPEDAGIGTCEPAAAWARAAAAGVVARSDRGELLLDLDGDGDIRTGWVLQYLHVNDRPKVGTRVAVGDPLGHPSCEGGLADSAHLHIARRYNGLWVAATGPVPFTLDGWTPWGNFEYDGGLTKPGERPREACNCRDRERNGLIWQAAQPTEHQP